MTGRSVSEWIATHPDQAIPKSVKLRIWEREDGRCYLTGIRINALKDEFEYEHVIALAHGGQHRESNIKLALKDAHKAKSKADAGVTAKIRRVSLKHKGLWTSKSGQKIPRRQNPWGYQARQGR